MKRIKYLIFLFIIIISSCSVFNLNNVNDKHIFGTWQVENSGEIYIFSKNNTYSYQNGDSITAGTFEIRTFRTNSASSIKLHVKHEICKDTLITQDIKIKIEKLTKNKAIFINENNKTLNLKRI